MIALVFLPETRSSKQFPADAATEPQRPLPSSPDEKVEFYSIIALFSVNRLVMAGILMSTLGIFLFDQIGEER